MKSVRGRNVVLRILESIEGREVADETVGARRSSGQRESFLETGIAHEVGLWLHRNLAKYLVRGAKK
jgi:hypothetical protein